MHTCRICGKQFPTAFRLKRHQLVHQPKQFACKVCGRHFKFKDNLQRHGVTHAKQEYATGAYKYDTLASQCDELFRQVDLRAYTHILDPCGGWGSTLQRYLTARGHTVRCNDRYRVAQHHCDLYKGSGLRELARRHRVDAVVSSPPYGRYTIESAVLAILSLRVPLTILKVPTSFLKRPVCVTHPPSLVIPLPRARYPSFETCTKWPETWVVWSEHRSSTGGKFSCAAPY